MNLIKELDKIAVDIAYTEHPLYFLLFQEMELNLNNDYSPIYLGDYEKIFNKKPLNNFFEGELSYDELLKAKNLEKLQLDNKELIFYIIKERLEDIKHLDSPIYNEEKLIILKAIADSINQYIPLPYSGKSLHKNELLTLLAITGWNYKFITVGGWGVNYVAIVFEITTIFTEIVELEIYFPYEEMKKLIQQLPVSFTDVLNSDLESSKFHNDAAQKMLKRVDNNSKGAANND